jgi:serine/threonine protein kinase
MASLEGQTLGSYEILTKLGQGGMGAVYKARDTRLQRFVAIKILPVQLATDEEFVQRFQREAIAAAQFCHSNLVQVFDIGESSDLHFIIMELVEGESLGHRLQRKGRMPPREAIAVTMYIGQALAYAWNKAKLIHRDIKPANIFLSKDGEVKLGDLGLAKSLQDAASGLTLSGTIMGTPHYMSPEQGRGDKQLDFRSDIYSLGCVLYHMLTGDPPYQGDSTATLIYKHVHEAPPALRTAAPDCPEDLADTVEWMMAKKPEDRPQTYEEMLGELAAVRHALLHAPAVAPKPAAPQTPPANVPSHAPVTMAEKKAPVANEPKSPSFGLIMTGTVVISVLTLGLFIWAPWNTPSRAGTTPGPTAGSTPSSVPSIPTQPPVAAQPLEPGAIKLWKSPDEIPNKPEMRWENSSVIFKGNTGNGLKWMLRPSRDAIIRADFQVMADSASGQIGLRLTEEGVARNKTGITFYRLALTTNGMVLASVKASNSSELQRWPLPRAYAADEWVRLELRAVGAELTASIDGHVLGTVHDETISDVGGVMINGRPSGSFRNMVYIPLDKPFGEAAAPASKPTGDDAFLRAVAALPAEQQVQRVMTKLQALNPEFDPAAANEQHLIENGAVVKLSLWSFGLRDLTPLRALSQLRDLSLQGTLTPAGNTAKKGAIKDLSPLAGMKLVRLSLLGNEIADLSPLKGMPLVVFNCDWNSEITNLSPLTGMPLEVFSCVATKVGSLAPLKGSRIEKLYIENTPVADLSPMAELPLKRLHMRWARVRDLAPLRRMPLDYLLCDEKLAAEPGNRAILSGMATLRTICNKPIAEFWKQVDAGKPPGTPTTVFEAFAREVAALPAEEQVKRVVAKLKELNPGYNGLEVHRVKDGRVDTFAALSGEVTNIAPVAALKDLEFFGCGATALVGNVRVKLSDLSPLKGLPLKILQCPYTSVRDLSPLQGMPLTTFFCHGSLVSDLSPLQGMKLLLLNCQETEVSDLSVLRDMPLRLLFCDPSIANDKTNRSVLRSIKTLEKINNQSVAEFWAQSALPEARNSAGGSVDDPARWSKAINLLPLIDPKKNSVWGKWRIEDGALICESGGTDRIEIPYNLPEEYDFRIKFIPMDGREQVRQILAKSGRQFIWSMGYRNKPMFCFESINGKDTQSNPTAVANGPSVKSGVLHESIVQVRNDGLKAFFNGKLLAELKTDYQDMRLSRGWALHDESCLGVGALEGHVRFERLELLEVTGKGALLRSAPAQPGSSPAVKQEIKALFNGRNLTGWRARDTNKKNEWNVRSGTLVTTKPGTDLVTEEQFSDFLFHCEFKLAAGANSGVYLRGRYEIQLMDDHGKPVTDQTSGGIYKLIAPSVNAIKSPGVWQTLDAAVAGHRVQVILNGKKVVENGLLSKPTVNALDQNIDQSGPLLLQSFAGQVEFRNLLLLPLNPGVNLQTLTFPAGWPSPRRN